MYLKYAPNLSEAELNKKVSYAMEQDQDAFINAFYNKYTGGAPSAEQSQYIQKKSGFWERKLDNIEIGLNRVVGDLVAGAEQLAEIREIIEHDKVSCIFSEPQFNPDIINAVAKDMDIKTGVLDPLGATLNPGKDLYFDLIKNMSKSFKGC